MAKKNDKPNKPKAEIGGVPVWCAFSEIISTAEVRANPRNPNQHPIEQIDLLAKILKEQGWRWPIKVSTRSGYIVSGHCRLAAAKRAGMTSVPVDYQDYGSDEAEIADMLADNRVQELSILDDDLAMSLVSDLNTAGYDTELTGFDFDPSGGFTVPDEGEDAGDAVPEVQFTEELMESKNYVVLTFDNDIDWLQAQTLFNLKTVKALSSKPGYEKKGIGRVINGAEAINRLLGAK
jgi:hypothetical protein